MSKIKCTYGHIVSCALDIQHYCANTDCEECYFYSELPNGQTLDVPVEDPRQQDNQLEGQMSIDDWNYEVMEV